MRFKTDNSVKLQWILFYGSGSGSSVHIAGELYVNLAWSTPESCPDCVARNKILPQLINAFEYSNAGSAILAPVFKIGKKLDSKEYQGRRWPICQQCCGSGIRCLFDPWILDPGWVTNQDPDMG